MGIPHSSFEKELEKLKDAKGVKQDTDLTAIDLEELVKQYKNVYVKATGGEFPSDLRLYASKQNGDINLAKMILLATNITSVEFDKAKAAGFADTMIMEPLRASMVASCLQRVFETGKNPKAKKYLMDLFFEVCFAATKY